MRPTARPLLCVLSAVALLLGLSACTLKATLDTTSDGVTNFLSSTTGKTWFTEDGLVREDLKVEAFTFMNFENLKQDMAQGHGEYLASIGTLLGVPENRRMEFFSLAQSRYPLISGSSPSAQLEMIEVLRRASTLN